MTVWVSSDPHFLHRKVSELRGFTSVEEHNETIIENVNRVVKADDIFWWLGDMGLGRSRDLFPFISRLNGHRQLILGNHDAPFSGNRDARKHQKEWLEVFESVQSYARISVAGTMALLSHFPYSGDHTAQSRYNQYRLRDEGEWLLHGHVHSELKVWPHGPRQIHVGLDAWDMKPVKDLEVAELMKSE